jgi:hypothetical protein
MHFGPCDCSAGGPDAASDSGSDATTPLMDGATGSDANARDSGGGDACPPGLTCNVGCPGGGTTTITGTVYDPAVKNPVYGAVVYVPGSPLQPLPKGVPSGAAACSCAALYPSAVGANTRTRPDGTFTLTNVPVGGAVPLVVQIGKWRRLVHVNVTACQDNPQPAGSLALPARVTPGSDDNMPDIAVSTGGADTLECLLLRMGLPASEYVAGAATNGHVHMFSGGVPGGNPVTNPNIGTPEATPFPGAPVSATGLWATAQQMLPYDITLLSCEGGETYAANPPVLEAYLNAGGRVLASHYHYSWFAGPLLSMQSYVAPTDWGSKLATWSDAGTAATTTLPIGGILDTMLNGKTTPFPKGVALQHWLTFLGSRTDGGVLGADGVAAGELPIFQPRYNAVVGPTDTASQAWITSDATGMAGQTMLFSFNMPLVAPPAPACGRAVFSDIHAEGDPATTDTPPAPGGCANVDLSPQEKALEFVLFDLSGCVVPDTANP